jgi:hypothetical protein
MIGYIPKSSTKQGLVTRDIERALSKDGGKPEGEPIMLLELP